MTSGSLCNYYRFVMDDGTNENNANYGLDKTKTTISKSFYYNTKIIGNKPIDNNVLARWIVVLLKNLSNFWRSIDLPLINC